MDVYVGQSQKEGYGNLVWCVSSGVTLLSCSPDIYMCTEKATVKYLVSSDLQIPLQSSRNSLSQTSNHMKKCSHGLIAYVATVY